MASSQLSMFSAANPTVAPSPTYFFGGLRYESIWTSCGHKIMDTQTGCEAAFLSSPAWTEEQVDVVVDMLNWAELRSISSSPKGGLSWRR